MPGTISKNNMGLMHSKKTCFLCLVMVAALLLIISYVFSEIISQRLGQLVVPKQQTVYRESAMTADRLTHYLLKNGPNIPSSNTEKELVSDGEMFIIPKEKLKFYQTKLRSRPGKLSRKIFKEVPDDAHRKVMRSILAVGRNDSSLLKSTTFNFMDLPASTQEKMYFSTLANLGYEKRLPTVINVGAKKAGTTALGLFLRSHPDVATSLGNEVHYFDWNYDKGIEYYRSRMQYSTEKQHVFEKTPRYLITQDAPQRIKSDISPDVKIIMLVRDPVERAISDYHHEVELMTMRQIKSKQNHTPLKMGHGPIVTTSFEKTVIGKDGEVNSETEIIYIGKYVEHLKNWIAHFPLNQLLILDGDQLSKSPVRQMKLVEKFLDLEPYFTENHFEFNPKYKIYCLALPQPSCRFSSPHRIPKPILSHELKTKLYDFYRPYNRELAKFINQTFPWMELET